MEGISPEILLETFSRFSHDETSHLRPIDLLIKHRELYGFSVLDSLVTIACSCLAAGPKQGHLEKPLIDDGQEILKQFRKTAAMRAFAAQELGFLRGLVKLPVPSSASSQSASISQNDFNTYCLPRLKKTIELLNWARITDSRNLRIQLHTLQIAQTVSANGIVTPSIFPNTFKLKVTVSWKTVLGKEFSECFSTGNELYSLSSSPVAATSNNNNTNTEDTAESDGMNPNDREYSSDTFNFTLGTGSISQMSFDQTAPTSQTAVSIAKLFRTSCSGFSCTVRVAVETHSGMEFAHGTVRASFQDGDPAPCASFSVPLYRPHSLAKMHYLADSSSTSNNNNNNSSSSNNQNLNKQPFEDPDLISTSTGKVGGKSSSIIVKKNKAALKEKMSELLGRMRNGPSGGNETSSSSSSLSVTNRHQRISPSGVVSSSSGLNGLGSSVGDHVSGSSSLSSPLSECLAGTIAIDIDSIASSFINLVALTQLECQKREQEEEERKRKRQQMSERDADDDDDDDQENIILTQEEIESEKKKEREEDDIGNTISYFLRHENNSSGSSSDENDFKRPPKLPPRKVPPQAVVRQ